MKLKIVLLFVACSLCNLFASFPFVRNFSKNSIHAGSQNWSIVQAETDWIYIANNRGLLEYDGYKWSVYQNKSNTLIRSLFFDKKSKRLYAGSYNEFGFFERDSRGVLRYHLICNSASINVFSDVWNIHRLGNTFVFQTETELMVLVKRKLYIHKFKDKIYQSAVINGRLIVAQLNAGVSYYNGRRLIEFKDNGVLKNKVVRAILPYKGDQILFVTDSHGIFRFDGNLFSSFKTDIDKQIMEHQVFCAAINNNVLALGTVQNGLIIKNLANNSTRYSTTSTGLQNNTVLSLAFDNQENLWLGLDNGVDYCMINTALTDLIGNPNVIGAGYTSCIYNGMLYLGTNQGLYCQTYDESNLQATSTVTPITQVKGQVWHLLVWEGVLFCSSDKGLFVIEKNKISKVENLSGVWCVKPYSAMSNTFIGAEYDHFFVLKKVNGKWQKHANIKGMEESDRNFVIDSDGRIWITLPSHGVYRLTLNSNFDAFTQKELINFTSPLASYQRILISYYEHQLIASTVNGFYNYNSSMRKFTANETLNKVFAKPNTVSMLQFRPDSKIWSVASNKISVVSRLSRTSYAIDSSSFSYLNGKMIDGFEHVNFISPTQVIFATENGFTLYNPSNYRLKSKTSKLAFKSIVLTQPVDSVVHGYFRNSEFSKQHTFKHEHNSIRFEFVCSEFRNENSVLYSYMLDGFDSKWSSFSSSNSKEFSNIPPGNYIFRVKAKNRINLDQVETEYAFKILPPWYKTITAYIVYLVLLSLGVYLLIIFVEYKSEKAAREMELLKEQESLEQEKLFQIEADKKEKEIIALRNKNLEYDLKHKSQDLASSTMNLIRKNEILLEMNNHLNVINDQLKQKIDPQRISKEISSIQKDIIANIEGDNHWEKFQENFDLIYDNYLTRLAEAFPALTHNDKRICAYLRMNLSSKDIAPLVNTTYQSVEMSRHRLRKKLNLDRSVNLTDFLQHF